MTNSSYIHNLKIKICPLTLKYSNIIFNTVYDSLATFTINFNEIAIRMLF